MTTQRHKPPAPWPLIVLYIIIIICILVVREIYFRYEKNALLKEKQLELSAISDLKIRQITQWRLERIGDGRFLGDNILIVSKLSELIRNPENQILRRNILQSLKSLTDNFDYKNVLLLDSAGKVVMAFPDQYALVGDHLRPLLPGIKRDRKVVLTDLHRASLVGFVHLDLIIPLIDHSINDTLVQGLLALRVDPQKLLYPLIQSWPAPSKTAETLIFRRDSDQIVYLNELRHLKNTELILKRPVNSGKLPAAMALNGITGTIDAIDYRNVPVVAAMKKIPGTQWFMVAKIDREEVIADLNNQMEMVFIIQMLVILAIGLFLGTLWRNQRVKFYREKYETEVNRLALIKHFDYILKFANDIILLFDKDLNIVEANDKALESYGYAREELIGMKLEEIRAPETISHMREQLRRVEEDESATFETVHKRKDNSTFQVEISSRLVSIEGLRYYQTIGRDITDRKSVENTLKESEEKFRKIFEESPFSILMTGKDFVIARANESFCNLIGYDEEELKSMTFRDFTHPEHIGENEVSLMKMIAGEIPVYHTEKRYIRKDNSIIWGSTTISIIRNSKGEIQFFLVMVDDITSRKTAEADLIAAKEKAEESDRLKTAFLHNVSHEIRTPMNAIIGFSTLLNEPDLSQAEHKQYIDIINESSSQLLSIINDIMDIANVESGQVRLNLREVNLNSSLIKLNEQFSNKTKQNNIPVILSLGLSENESIIVTDITKLIQVLSNLISNALKFTKKGKIDFGYVRKEGFLEFNVKDTGIGISEDHRDKIFNRFYQIDGAVSRKYGGTGLGLSICKAYVELMGGEISVTSVSGEGTRFTFTIPYKKDKR